MAHGANDSFGVGSYHVPCFGYRMLGLGSCSHKVGCPTQRGDGATGSVVLGGSVPTEASHITWSVQTHTRLGVSDGL